VRIPLSTLNRHGLVAGATGTGKTKTLQKLSESLSRAGVPVLVMDVKGDFSGISQPGEMNDRIKTRQDAIGLAWTPTSFPVEFLTISNAPGVKMRATVSEFGPVLFSKVLELNDTQTSVTSLIFKYCDDKGLLLLDLKDFKKVLQYLTNEGKTEIAREYGAISPTTTSTIMRKIIEIEEQGADVFFGEMSFDVLDLCRRNANGQGTVNVFRVADMQNRPKMYSTFMLSLLAEIYNTFPEEGDMLKPKLTIIIDEAHLIFDEASSALLDQIETTIKLIRSKGIAIIFCTQNPADIPASVLGQLGMKIQHALRAFTANDRKAIRLGADNYPDSSYYKTEDVITQLGIGEALVTCLSEQGAPTPLVSCLVSSPESRMDTISESELLALVNRSPLSQKYNQVIDRESAYELLNKKIEGAADASGVGDAAGGVLGGLAGAIGSQAGKFLINQAKLVIGQIIRSQMRGAFGTLTKKK
jgi:DNA helicase HerA-like ATPase